MDTFDVNGALPSATYSICQEYVPKLPRVSDAVSRSFIRVQFGGVCCVFVIDVVIPLLWSRSWDTGGMVYEHP